MHMKKKLYEKKYMKRIEGTGRKGGRRSRTERGGGAASRQGRQWGRAPATTSTMVGAGRGAGAQPCVLGDGAGARGGSRRGLGRGAGARGDGDGGRRRRRRRGARERFGQPGGGGNWLGRRGRCEIFISPGYIARALVPVGGTNRD